MLFPTRSRPLGVYVVGTKPAATCSQKKFWEILGSIPFSHWREMDRTVISLVIFQKIHFCGALELVKDEAPVTAALEQILPRDYEGL